MNPLVSPNLRVGDVERARAESVLQEAYCVGRLDEVELDERLGRVMTAQTRRDLGVALAGLPASPAPRPPGHVAASVPPSQATPLGGLAHLSGLFSWVFGPLFCYALATPGTPARREAARAFNFQLATGVSALVIGIVGSIVLPDPVLSTVMLVGWVGWFLLSILSGARALSGQPWNNPIPGLLHLEVLDASGR